MSHPGPSSPDASSAGSVVDQSQYRQIFEATSDGLVINDLATGVVVEANPAFCRMHGYSHDEMVGLHPTTFIHPDDHHLFADYVGSVTRGRRFLTRARDVRKDGSIFDVEVNGTQFTFHGTSHILGVVRDVSVEVQARTAALEERHRIARDLHDSVSQSLFSLTLYARTAELALRRAEIDSDTDLAMALQEVGELSRGALAEMRALIFELRPGALAEEGLGSALSKHAAAVAARERIPITVSVPDARVVLEPGAEEHLYRVAQEAIHNAVKHARPNQIEVTLERTAAGLRLEVRDDGSGFDARHGRPGHIGLQTMAERVAALHGELAIESSAGDGTAVVAQVPLSADDG
jgi:PAS domain S-box-containing protein